MLLVQQTFAVSVFMSFQIQGYWTGYNWIDLLAIILHFTQNNWSAEEQKLYSNANFAKNSDKLRFIKSF